MSYVTRGDTKKVIDKVRQTGTATPAGELVYNLHSEGMPIDAARRAIQRAFDTGELSRDSKLRIVYSHHAGKSKSGK